MHRETTSSKYIIQYHGKFQQHNLLLLSDDRICRFPLLLLLSALTENTNLLCSAIKIRCEFAYLHITTAALSALETCQDHNLISANYKITVPDITLVLFSGDDDGGSGLIDRFGGHAPRIYRSARGAEQDWLEKRTGNWKSTTITAVARKNSIGTILANI